MPIAGMGRGRAEAMSAIALTDGESGGTHANKMYEAVLRAQLKLAFAALPPRAAHFVSAEACKPIPEAPQGPERCYRSGFRACACKACLEQARHPSTFRAFLEGPRKNRMITADDVDEAGVTPGFTPGLAPRPPSTGTAPRLASARASRQIADAAVPPSTRPWSARQPLLRPAFVQQALRTAPRHWLTAGAGDWAPSRGSPAFQFETVLVEADDEPAAHLPARSPKHAELRRSGNVHALGMTTVSTANTAASGAATIAVALHRPPPISAAGISRTRPSLDSSAPASPGISPHLNSQPSHRRAPILGTSSLNASALATAETASTVAAPAAPAQAVSTLGDAPAATRHMAELGSLEKEIPISLTLERRRELAERVSKFEKRHRDFKFSAHRALKGVQRDPTSSVSGRAFEHALVCVQRNRLFVPEAAAAPVASRTSCPRDNDNSNGNDHRGRSGSGLSKGNDNDIRGRVGSGSSSTYRIAESIWRGREKWSDSKDFWDTDRCLERAVQTDWRECIETSNLTQFLLKHDAAMKTKDPNSVPRAKLDAFLKEMESVFVVNARLFLSAFDHYATQSPSDDLFHITNLGYSAFLEECELVVSGSGTADMGNYDLIFVVANTAVKEGALVNALGIYQAPEKKTTKRKRFEHNSKLGFTRAEFMQCLCRVAVARYVLTGRAKLTDVSDALVKLFETMKAKCDPATRQDSNEFRDKYCYTQATDSALRMYEPALRMLYERYAKGDGDVGKKQAESNKLLSVVEWVQLARDLAIIDDDLSIDDARLIFLWSRMRVIDENALKSREKVENLSFWDFLEAIVRAALCKALPTDDQLEASGQADAFEFLMHLRETSREKYENFVKREDGEWWDTVRQPTENAVGHLLNLMVRTLNHRLGRLEAQIPPKSKIRVKHTPVRVQGGKGSGLEMTVLTQLSEALENQRMVTQAASAIIQSGSRVWLTKARRRLQSGNATMIQAIVRARRMRKRMKASHAAVLRIQRQFRGFRTRLVMYDALAQARAYFVLVSSRKRMRPHFARSKASSTSSLPSTVDVPLPSFVPTFAPLASKRSYDIARPIADRLLQVRSVQQVEGWNALRLAVRWSLPCPH